VSMGCGLRFCGGSGFCRAGRHGLTAAFPDCCRLVRAVSHQPTAVHIVLRRLRAGSPGSCPSLTVTLAIGITLRPIFDLAPV
jgi:hypothetical protein